MAAEDDEGPRGCAQEKGDQYLCTLPGKQESLDVVRDLDSTRLHHGVQLDGTRGLHTGGDTHGCTDTEMVENAR